MEEFLAVRFGAILDDLAKPPATGRKQAPIFDVFDEEGLDSIRRAIAYATAHDLGLMEATDLVVPFANESYTDIDNLRAHFLENVAYAEPGKSPSKKTGPKKAVSKKPVSKKAARQVATSAVKRTSKKTPAKASSKKTIAKTALKKARPTR